MSDEPRLWSTSVHELVSILRAAMTALTPSLDRCHIAWRKPGAYDEWDGISAALHRSIVVASIANRVGRDIREAEFATYGAHWTNDCNHSLITVRSAQLPERDGFWAFAEFESDSGPFDRVRCVALDEQFVQVDERTVDLESVEFHAAVRVGASVVDVSSMVVEL